MDEDQPGKKEGGQQRIYMWQLSDMESDTDSEHLWLSY